MLPRKAIMSDRKWKKIQGCSIDHEVDFWHKASWPASVEGIASYSSTSSLYWKPQVQVCT